MYKFVGGVCARSFGGRRVIEVPYAWFWRYTIKLVRVLVILGIVDIDMVLENLYVVLGRKQV
jgi:hypothetical protein